MLRAIWLLQIEFYHSIGQTVWFKLMDNFGVSETSGNRADYSNLKKLALFQYLLIHSSSRFCGLLPCELSRLLMPLDDKVIP